MHRILFLFFTFLITQTHAQRYVTAGGVRFSNEGFGLTVQQKLFDHTSIEGIGQINFNEASFTAMIEHHNNILFTKSFNVYAGIGPSIGTYLLSDSSYVGFNIILGAEYKVLLLPILISADIKPAFKLQEEDWFHMSLGLSFRYVFIKEKRKRLFGRD